MDDNNIPKLNCIVCGGADFFLEGGYYFCSECQTQTQEIREQEYDVEQAHHEVKNKSKASTKSRSSTNTDTRLTSWEGYNYILAGLVDQLINLGESTELKEVTYQLWISYLMELEILSKKGHAPKLGANYKMKYV